MVVNQASKLLIHDFLETTILQLIASKMIMVEYVVLEDNKHITKVVLKLEIDNITPAYLLDKYWINWKLIN